MNFFSKTPRGCFLIALWCPKTTAKRWSVREEKPNNYIADTVLGLPFTDILSFFLG